MIPISRAQAVYSLEVWSLHVSDSLSTSRRCLWVRTCGMATTLIETDALCLAFFLSQDVCPLGRWIAFPICPPKFLLHQGWRCFVGVCRITPADEGLHEIQNKLIRKVGEAHMDVKSGLCIRYLNCSETFLKVCKFRDDVAQF